MTSTILSQSKNSRDICQINEGIKLEQQGFFFFSIFFSLRSVQIVIIRQNILSQIFPSQQMSSHPSPNFGDLICLATILWIKICNRFVGYKVLKIRKLEHSGCSLFLLELYRYYHVIFCLFVPHNSIPTLALKQKLHLLWSFHS